MILDIILCYVVLSIMAWIIIPRLRALKQKLKEKPRVDKQKT